MNILVSVTSKSDKSAQNVTYPINGQLLLGRSPDSVIPLDGPGISRDHLAIDVDGSTLFITDLSSNGTWLNGTRLPKNRKSKAGETDVLEIPGYEIRIQLVADSQPSTDGTPLVTSGASVPGLRAEEQLASSTRQSSRISFRSFTFLEMMLVLVALLSFSLVLMYLLT